MLNRKSLIKRWNQTHYSSQVNLSRTACKSGTASPIPHAPTVSKNYEKLRKKMWEMKHRVCVLEFGLGSVAKIMGDIGDDGVSGGPQTIGGNVSNGGHFHGVATANAGNNDKYKEALMGIGEILQDIESCMKPSQAEPPSSLRTEPTSHTPVTSANKNGTDSQLLEIATVSQPCKARIYIDETTTGENSLTVTTTTDLCSTIRVMENPIFSSFTSPPFYQQQKSINIIANTSTQNEIYKTSVNPIMTSASSVPSFDALSTLASVASSKHAEELGIGTNASCPQVNPFVFSEETGESDSLSALRKRRRISMSPSAGPRARGGGGMNTRRVARQRDRNLQK